MNKPRNTIRLFHTLLLLVFLSRGVVSQSLQDQEQSVLLKLKEHWGDLPHLRQWRPSNISHCSWPGITCESNSVTELSLINIDIVGKVPPFICDLKNLTVLNLGMNSVTGEFPRALYNCSKLEHLDLSNNYFVGKLPDDIDRLVRLRSLVLGGNNFTGDFPVAIGGLKELRVLNLGGNLFDGTLIPEIGNLTNLEVLNLSTIHHLLPSRLPWSFGKLRNLKEFWGFGSNVIGEIPESFGDLEALEWLDISQNGLTGKIPDGLFLLKNLSIVYLYTNNLSGEIPQVVDAPNLTMIDLSDNNLTGKIPEGFGNLTKMIGLALFSNNLSGPIPEGIGKLQHLQDLNLGDNSLSGDLPPELGKNSKLRNLQVSSNRLTGQFPNHLCSNGNLVGLVAYDNGLTGALPESLANCSRLVIVNVQDNRLSGHVPSGLWTSPNLTRLVLSNNLFSGELPKKVAGNLIMLEVSNNRLSGEIPTESSSWRNFVAIEASNNLLSGTIPQELTTLAKLRTLLLDQNQLSGDLPSDIGSWESLLTLNLSRNQLSGEVPVKLSMLPALSDLDLSQNRFSGKVPSQLAFRGLHSLNLSSNNLEGNIPREFEIAAYAKSFLNNPGLCASNKVLQLRLCNKKQGKLSTPYLAVIVTVSSAVFLLAVLFLFFLIRRNRTRRDLPFQWRLTSFRRLKFTQSDILSGLTDHNLIGSGGSGKVYRIPIDRQGNAVAAKKIWSDRKPDNELEKEFLAEVKILSSIQHANIVKLFCCISIKGSKLLVYEYMGNQSLYQWLHDRNMETAASASSSVQNVLDWQKRVNIAAGIAHGLSYMHHDCRQPIIHRDIKSSNILLDADFNAKIADFGLAKLLAKQGELVTISSIAGSFGYMAPEYAQTRRVNEKIDVYSFGAVLLELATGRKANHGDEHTSLAQWAWRCVEEGKLIEECLDEKVMKPENVEEMSRVFGIGLRCTATNPSERPTMREVVKLLVTRVRPLANG